MQKTHRRKRIEWAAAALLLAASAMLVGCPKSDGDGASTATNPSSNHAVGDLSDFQIEKPPAFTGEFNPNGMEVGVAVGKLAPEIEGEDLDGTPFKLSDYRGKVVMLDFWGDW